MTQVDQHGIPAAAPIVIDPSKIKAQLVQIGVLLAFTVSFVSAVAGFLAKRDLAGFIMFMQNDQTLAGISGVFALALVIWRQIATRRRKDAEVAMAIVAPIAELSKPAVVTPGSIVDQALQTAAAAGELVLDSKVDAAAPEYAVKTDKTAPETAPSTPEKADELPEYAR